MDSKELQDRCNRIATLFDMMPAESSYNCPAEPTIMNFVETLFDPKLDAMEDLADENDDFRKRFVDAFCQAYEVVFAVAFVMGQEFDLTYPEAKEDVEAIRQVIREECLLPYLRRERKEAKNPRPSGQTGN